MKFDLEIQDLSDDARAFLLMKANELKCAPAGAVVRIVEDSASSDLKKGTPPADPEGVAARASGHHSFGTASPADVAEEGA